MNWTVLASFVLTGLLLCGSFVEAASDSSEKAQLFRVFEQRIKNVESSGQMPIIDVEFHCGKKIDLKELTVKMDANHVALTWLGPTEGLGDEYSVQANQQFPEYFVPTIIHGDGRRWHGKDPGLLDVLADDAHTGRYFAMGEFEARHYVSDTNNRNVHLPLTNPSFHRIFQLSQETGLPFLIHHEAEDAMLPEMESMLQQYPQAKVVWCHVGRNRNYTIWSRWMGTKTVRDFLEKYPNLYFDLVQSPPNSSPFGYRQCIMYDVNGATVTLNHEWKKLFMDFPDRFVIGSDVNGGRWEQYDDVFGRLRTVVLQALPREVAEKIAYKNAWNLMSAEKWQP